MKRRSAYFGAIGALAAAALALHCSDASDPPSSLAADSSASPGACGTPPGDAPASSNDGALEATGYPGAAEQIDPQRGVAATLLMQVLPFYDDGAIRALQAFETAVYRELAPPAE